MRRVKSISRRGRVRAPLRARNHRVAGMHMVGRRVGQAMGCYDIASGTILGGNMDGYQPHPTAVSNVFMQNGVEVVRIGMGGDVDDIFPICDTGGGNGNGGGSIPHPDHPDEPVCAPTYGDPPVVVGPDGCDIGYNGCGDTVRVESLAVAAGATIDVVTQAAVESTPRYFIYTGPLATFLINNVRVANGPDSNFGDGYRPDIYSPAVYASRRVSWPTFYNSPGLIVNITNTTAAVADFTGILIVVAAHLS